jgi:precorrin-4/cobalt-precorrin-4 C11-methyltransferase
MAHMLSRTYGKDCPAAAVHRASWPNQRIIRGTLADIADRVEASGIEARTTMFIVGHALARKIPASKLYDEDFAHGYRWRKPE